MTLGKSIRIYLKEGSVTGIKFAELVNQTIQALSCPRTKLSDLNNHFQKEINTQGVYFLLGYEEDTLKSKVYIGEAENVWERLKSHDLKKDFWNEVIMFTSKDDNLTKSHIKYLESRIVEITKDAERYTLENGNKPTLSSLPLPDKDAMEEFLSNIKLLTGTLGHKFLENPISGNTPPVINIPLTASTENNIIIDSIGDLELFLNIKGIKANAIQTNEGLVVLQNSEVATNSTKNYGYGTLREKLISDGIIQKKDNGKMTFSKNYLFTSVSGAAAVIVGYSINGRSTWKNKEGRSIKEIEKSEIK
jgi:hypothetical protein